MKATGETSDEESEGEDGESNLALMDKSAQTQTTTPPRTRTGLGYKNKPVKCDRKRKYVGLAEYKLCSHCEHIGHVSYEFLARIKAL
ncbi:hypothetical protein HAX54_016974 [Datura stramonium]|uniref:Uncharacterized protein n=1 Tax=Datura stramonium TaxID=4076 RepID=A0ABS8UJT0_DATST|nr:hypothetical protein [Datura stramonium]